MGIFSKLLGGGGGTQTQTQNTNYSQNTQSQQQQFQTQLQQALQQVFQQQQQQQQQQQLGQQTQSANVGPWAAQQNFILDAFNRAQGLVNDPNSRVAQFSPTLTAAGTSAISTANDLIPQLLTQGQGALNTAINAADVSNNPALPGLIEAAIRPVDRALNEQWLPSIRSNFVSGGTYGSSKQGIAEGLALRGAHENALDATSRIMSDAYGQGLNANAQALSMIPGLVGASSAPVDLLERVGLRETARSQAVLDEPSRRLQEYFQIISPSFGSTSTSTGTTAQTGTASSQATSQSESQSTAEAIAEALGLGSSSTKGQSSSISVTELPKGDPLKGLLGIGSLIASLYTGGLIPPLGGSSWTFTPNTSEWFGYGG